MKFLNSKFRRQYSPRIHKAITFLVFIFLVWFLVLIHQTFFVVKKWECKFGKDTCPDSVSSIVKNYLGRSILRINQGQIIKEVLSTGWGQNPVLGYTIQGSLKLSLEPNSLTFPIRGYWQDLLPDLSLFTATSTAQLISPSLELASFIASQSGQLFRLTSSGLLIEGGEDSRVILISQRLRGRDYLPEVFSWIKEISFREVNFNYIYFVDNTIIVEQASPPDLIFNLDQKPQNEITALQEIKKAATIKDVKVIDFRYNHPILK